MKSLRVMTMALLGLTGVPLLASGQPPMNRGKSQLERLDDVARASASSSATDIRRLTDFVFDSTGFEVPQNSTLRERLFRAETEFRRGEQHGITEDQAASALNDLVDWPLMPSWARTNAEQVRIFRGKLRGTVPHLVGAKGRGKQIFGMPRTMSPAEAVFVTLTLSVAKLHNRDYREKPEVWVQKEKSKSRGGKRSPQGRAVAEPKNAETPRARGVVEVVNDADLLDAVASISADLRDESTIASTQAHAFLDRLGVRR
jgi:hypothetical protein